MIQIRIKLSGFQQLANILFVNAVSLAVAGLNLFGETVVQLGEIKLSGNEYPIFAASIKDYNYEDEFLDRIVDDIKRMANAHRYYLKRFDPDSIKRWGERDREFRQAIAPWYDREIQGGFQRSNFWGYLHLLEGIGMLVEVYVIDDDVTLLLPPESIDYSLKENWKVYNKYENKFHELRLLVNGLNDALIWRSEVDIADALRELADEDSMFEGLMRLWGTSERCAQIVFDDFLVEYVYIQPPGDESAMTIGANLRWRYCDDSEGSKVLTALMIYDEGWRFWSVRHPDDAPGADN